MGAVSNSGFLPIPDTPVNTGQQINFTEKSLLLTLNQLLGKEWSLGARYQLSHAELLGRFVDIPSPAANSVNQNQTATLQQLTLAVNYYHPCGFFSQAQALWTAQDNQGYTPGLPGDKFWQFNAYAGYRLLQRAVEVKVGLLNIGNQDYLLNPLNFYYDLPRQRTLALSLKFYF